MNVFGDTQTSNETVEMHEIDTNRMNNDAFRNNTNQMSETNTKTLRFLRAVENAFVTDISTGFIYLNKYIFDCFKTEVTEPVTWHSQFKMDIPNYQPTSLESIAYNMEFNAYRAPFPEDAMSEFQKSAYCLRGDEPGTHRHLRYINTCRDGGFQEWADKCNGFTSLVAFLIDRINIGFYKNRYCAFCHLGTDNDVNIVPLLNPSYSGKTNMMFSALVSHLRSDGEFSLSYNFVDKAFYRHRLEETRKLLSFSLRGRNNAVVKATDFKSLNLEASYYAFALDKQKYTAKMAASWVTVKDF